MAPITSRLQASHSAFPQVRQKAVAGVSTWMAQFIGWLLHDLVSDTQSQHRRFPGCSCPAVVPDGCWYRYCLSSFYLFLAALEQASHRSVQLRNSFSVHLLGTESHRPGACCCNSAPPCSPPGCTATPLLSRPRWGASQSR